MIDAICADYFLLIVGNFNASVGYGKKSDPLVHIGVCGYHEVGRVNDNGDAVLAKCAQNDLAVMHTMFLNEKILYPFQSN